MTEESCPDVWAVVVTYLPDSATLANLLHMLSEQVRQICIVDNTPQADLRVPELVASLGEMPVTLIRLGDNHGIAAALNVGIKHALTRGAAHVLLSDQDSAPSSGMVRGLLRAHEALTGRRVAAVGPSFVNTNSGEVFPFLVDVQHSLFFGRRSASAEHPHIEALTLITSGLLVSAEALRDIGLMREDFFIDSVDTEWCYRARARGWRLFGTGWATMQHRMGDASLRVWYFGWFKANAYSPRRVYYQVRNLVRLHFLGYTGVRWRLRNVWSILGVFYFHVFYGAERRECLRMWFRGLLDGLRGRMGAFIP